MIHHETERLILRDFEESDLDAVYEYASCPITTRYLMWGPYNMEETKTLLANTIAAQNRRTGPATKFAVVTKDTNELIGRCIIAVCGDGSAELGWLLNPRFQRRGYTVEFARVLLKIGFETFGLHRIFAHCDAENYGSWRVMEKLGMRREAHFLETRPANKTVTDGRKYSDEYEYAILEREYFENIKGETK